MHRPAHLTAAEERRLDRLEDLAAAAAALRRAIAKSDRAAVETYCASLARRLALAPIDGDDAEEIPRHDRPDRGAGRVRRPRAAEETPPAAGRGRRTADRGSRKIPAMTNSNQKGKPMTSHPIQQPDSPDRREPRKATPASAATSRVARCRPDPYPPATR